MPTDHPDLIAARFVLECEIQGLHALSDALNNDFIAAIDCLHRVKGRVIISGMGKSGHIACKIAATLSSTGTPSHFVHPAEASHGDLGMITTDDAVLLLSNSGETSELSDIINYTRRFSIPLIGMVRRKTSRLVEAADIALILPEIAEASPIGAPTTSTTMMLALGDAIAVALLERKGFSKDDFGLLHPGGKLGAAFIKVSDLMHVGTELPTVRETTAMKDVLLEMTSKRFGCTAVVDKEGILLGVITDGDLRRHMRRDLLDSTAQEIMTRNPTTIPPYTLASAALGLMQGKITSLFICDPGQKPVGILHIHDILRAGVI